MGNFIRDIVQKTEEDKLEKPYFSSLFNFSFEDIDGK
jgi:hypothetical protein